MSALKLVVLAVVSAILAGPGHALLAAEGVDAEAAQKLAKKSDCFKCHSVEKEKKAPSYKKIAEKYRGKPEGEQKVIDNMTTAPKVKLEDGTEEEHKIVKSKDPAEIKNLADWILSQ